MLFITNDDELRLDKPLQSLYFYSSYLPFHKTFLTMISKMEDKHKDVSFYGVDTDHFKNQCKRFNVSSIPTVLLFKNGKEVKRINGLTLTSAFRKAYADTFPKKDSE